LINIEPSLVMRYAFYDCNDKYCDRIGPLPLQKKRQDKTVYLNNARSNCREAVIDGAVSSPFPVRFFTIPHSEFQQSPSSGRKIGSLASKRTPSALLS
jgi:hypothetical protein